MAEPLHRSSDVPDFDVYPANPPDPERLLPEQASRTALEERASQVGTAIGKVVVMVRRTQGRFSESGSTATDRITGLTDTAKTKASDLADMAKTKTQELTDLAKNKTQELIDLAKNKTQEWSEMAASRADELRQTAAERAADLRSQVRTRYYRTRLRANAVQRDYPLQLILAGGAAGFLLGVGLRIWRTNREY
ncbi:MAG: hypothetical protein DMG65_10305 [Candidatus Angelobacter sp. Gp1-AA117]|nr:MAG: hypothetical protein DMG65_10305 [Candidatus Angelobacter sp. Gp1-AA117]